MPRNCWPKAKLSNLDCAPSLIPGAIYVRISWPSRKSSTATPVSSAHVPSRKKNCFLCINKDLIERAFRSLKGIIQLRPVRHWLAERVRAHVFLCYLAYLFLSLLRYHLRNTEFTADRALNELGTMYKVYLRDAQHRFRLSHTVTLTKNQELILKAIDKSLLKT
jgi:hypothetical protein